MLTTSIHVDASLHVECPKFVLQWILQERFKGKIFFEFPDVGNSLPTAFNLILKVSLAGLKISGCILFSFNILNVSLSYLLA